MRPSDIGGGLADASLETAITRDGQEYVDQLVYLRNKPVLRGIPPKTAAAVVSAAFGRALPQVVVTIPNLIRRTRLRWMKPDGKGGLVPK